MMTITKAATNSKAVIQKKEKRPFSLWLFLVMVVLLSWPFQFWFVFNADTAWEKFLFSSIAMVMVSVGAFIAGRFVFRDGFACAGWRWGKPKHYLVAFGFALFLWLVPALIEQGTAMQQKRDLVVSSVVLLFLLHFIGTLLPAFGEEFGWRGYLLPKLATKYGVLKGLLVHAFIWWFWHLPVVIGMGIQESNNANTGIGGVLLFITITIIPSMLHAVIYAWIWARSGSVFVATIYHAAFDEVRDVLEKTIGFGYFTEVWQMVTIIVVGGLLLWKANWRLLLAGKSREQAIALHSSSLLNTN